MYCNFLFISLKFTAVAVVCAVCTVTQVMLVKGTFKYIFIATFKVCKDLFPVFFCTTDSGI